MARSQYQYQPGRWRWSGIQIVARIWPHLSLTTGCELLAANISVAEGCVSQHYEAVWEHSLQFTSCTVQIYLLPAIKFIASKHSLVTVNGRASGINYSSHTAVGFEMIADNLPLSILDTSPLS